MSGAQLVECLSSTHKSWLYTQNGTNLARRCTPVFLALGRGRQEDQEFKLIPGNLQCLGPAWDTRDLVSGKNEIVNVVNFMPCVFFHDLRKKDFILYADSFSRAGAIVSRSVCSTAGT